MLRFEAVSTDVLSAIRVFVFDLDGVLYRGAEPVVGAAETLAALRQRPDTALFFLTNNSSQDRSDYVEKLTHLGMPCSEYEVVTSSSATAQYLVDGPGAVGKRALAVGGHGIRNELARVGITVVRAEEPAIEGEAPFDYVVVGLDRNFTYHALNRAQQAILGGAAFVATNRDGQYPVEGGRVTPGAGAVVAAIEACTGVKPVVIGKPETLGLQTILTLSGARPDEAIMIGDRMDTDILCGNRLNVPSALVLTGVTTAEMIPSAAPEVQPRFVWNDLRDLLALL